MCGIAGNMKTYNINIIEECVSFGGIENDLGQICVEAEDEQAAIEMARELFSCNRLRCF